MVLIDFIPSTITDDIYDPTPFAAPGAIVHSASGDYEFRVFSANPYSDIEITAYSALGVVKARVVLGRENSSDGPTARVARSRGITNAEAIAAAPSHFQSAFCKIAEAVLL